MIGYWIHKDFEGQGYMTETVNALTRYAFEVFKVNRLEIRCDSRNTKSLSVTKKLGFTQEVLLKNEDRAEDNSLRHTVVTARYGVQNLPELIVRW
jgi:ribosomal-protein-serine acetyltransferase